LIKFNSSSTSSAPSNATSNNLTLPAASLGKLSIAPSRNPAAMMSCRDWWPVGMKVMGPVMEEPSEEMASTT
jgi:hypothetical protein